MNWADVGAFGAGIVVGAILAHVRRRHRRSFSLRVDVRDAADTGPADDARSN